MMRIDWYISEYGEKSWEVDALRPDVMIKLVNNSIAQLVDVKKMEKIIKKEKKDMRQLERFGEMLTRKKKKG